VLGTLITLLLALGVRAAALLRALHPDIVEEGPTAADVAGA
jgi:hypothetical protein